MFVSSSTSCCVSALELVGWDDMKGRPIFRTQNQQSAPALIRPAEKLKKQAPELQPLEGDELQSLLTHGRFKKRNRNSLKKDTVISNRSRKVSLSPDPSDDVGNRGRRDHDASCSRRGIVESQKLETNSSVKGAISNENARLRKRKKLYGREGECGDHGIKSGNDIIFLEPIDRRKQSRMQKSRSAFEEIIVEHSSEIEGALQSSIPTPSKNQANQAATSSKFINSRGQSSCTHDGKNNSLSLEGKKSISTSHSCGNHEDTAAEVCTANNIINYDGDQLLLPPNQAPPVFEPKDGVCAGSTDFYRNNNIFHEPKSRIRPNQKRRSYGAVKPVWPAGTSAATRPAGASRDSAASSQKVAWDYAKCRPIYLCPPAPSCPKSSSPTASNCRKPASAIELDTINQRTQRKVVYTSLFKRSGLSRADRDRMGIDSPSAASLEVDKESTNSDVDVREEINEKKNASDPVEKTKTNSSLNIDMELEAIMNDSNAHRPQPNSKSSLESARAFFRYLDTSHNLDVVDQSQCATPNNKTDAIRTKRSIVHCEQLKSEYFEYCEMVLNTGIKPISLTKFAENWNLHFTGRGVVRDGLFDEEY